MRLQHIDGVVMFVRAGIAGSFAAAARSAGVTPSAVSKAVSRLEARLGLRLFDRTTHAIRLTDAGRAYFKQCRAALDAVEEAERALLGRAGTPRGRLRVSASVPFAREVLAPLLPGFLDRYPEIEVELLSTDRMSDLVEDGVDLAIRTGRLADTGLVARKLIDTRMVAAASPGYFARRGVPEDVDALRDHTRLAFVFPQTHRVFGWFFDEDGARRAMAPGGCLAFSDAAAMVAAAEAGAGIVFLQDYILARSLREGRLIECLRERSADGGPVSAVWLPARDLSPAVRVFVDYLVAWAAQQP